MSRDRHGRMPGKVRRRPAIEDRQLHSREQRNGPIARHRVAPQSDGPGHGRSGQFRLRRQSVRHVF